MRVNDFRDMLLIRRTEEAILRLFAAGAVPGTTHTCIGQEANAVGVVGRLDPVRDYVVSNHRNHGHFLAFGGTPQMLLAEVMGREEGVCGGRGGSQHIKHGNFLSSGVQGGGAPVACGMALAEKLSGGSGIVAYCLGDGTLGEGALYEAMNIASLWSLPVLFLVENNGIAQTTPARLGVAGDIVSRGAAFGLTCYHLASTNVAELGAFAERVVATLRADRRPAWVVIDTVRLGPHSKGDDDRSESEMASLRARDPLLVSGAALPAPERAEAEAWVRDELDAAHRALGVVMKQ